jgi:probable biosynthetic protein (TIGR04098 family)
MEKYLQVIKGILPKVSAEHVSLPFAEVPIDSMDLASIRVSMERAIGTTIPDEDWVDFESLEQLIRYCEGRVDSVEKVDDGSGARRRLCELTIEMPQMAIEALSENWLFKELGGWHWLLLCQGLNTKSFDLKDDLGQRLYATFVRIRLTGTLPLCAFGENERLSVDGSISRFGGAMYFSSFEVKGHRGSIVADLMTTFSAREGIDNTKLTKTQPSSALSNSIGEVAENPDFGNRYRLLRKGEVTDITLGDASFSLSSDAVSESVYQLNPYYDLNGVGLLYFAAYPIINDVCEARYFNKTSPERRWELNYYTLSRDIFYLGNCNSNDEIVHRLHAVEYDSAGRLLTQSSLFRKSDGAPLARIFTVKEKRQ